MHHLFLTLFTVFLVAHFVNVQSQPFGLQLLNSSVLNDQVTSALQLQQNEFILGLKNKIFYSTSDPLVLPANPLLSSLADIPYCLVKKNESAFVFVVKSSNVFVYNIDTNVINGGVSASGEVCQDCAFDPISNTLWLSSGKDWACCQVRPDGSIQCTSRQPATNKEVYTVTIDTDLREVWHAGKDGYLQKTRLDNIILDPTLVKSKTLAGKIYSATYSPRQRAVYLGTDLGIIFEMNTTTFSLSRLLFLENSEIHSVLYDPSSDVTFWGAVSKLNNTIRVFRSNSKDFDLFAISDFFVASTFKTDLKGSDVIPVGFNRASNSMWWANGPNIYQFQITNCSAYSCQQCSLDYAYCGFCYSQLKCTRQVECDSSWTPAPYIECPELLEIIPNRGLSNGGTNVTIIGTSFLDKTGATLNTSLTLCKFDDLSSSAISVTLTTVTCSTPPHPSGIVSVTIHYNGSRYDVGNPLQFEYYDCSQSNLQNCSENSCLREPDCGWCYDTMSCSSRTACSGFWQQSCPVATAVPDSASIRGNQTIHVIISPYLPNFEYRCRFGELGSSLAQRINSTTLECRTPPFTLPSPPEMQITLEIYAVVNSSYSPLFTKVSDFLVYDCKNYSTSCAVCIDQYRTRSRKLECRYCFNQSNPRCVYFDEPLQDCGPTNGTCPYIESIIPKTRYYDRSPSLLNVTGSFSLSSSIIGLSLLCAWDVNGSRPLSYTSAIIDSPFLLQCLSPDPSTVGVHELSIWINRTGAIFPWTGTHPFTLYDCVSGPCSNCVDPENKPECYWCYKELSCKHMNMSCAFNGTIFTVTNRTLCPRLDSLFPTSDTLAGGTQIQLLGNFYFSFLPPLSTISCRFTLGVDSVPTSDYNDTRVACFSSPSQVAGESEVFIEVNNTVHTNSLNFTYFDCTTLPNNRDCTSCLNYKGCKWCVPSNLCSQNCSEDDIAFTNSQQCPRLDKVEPSVGWWLGNETLIVSGAGFDSDFQYRCSFGGDRTTSAQFLSETNITCLTPTTRPSIGNTTFSVLVEGTRPFANNSLPFEFYWCGDLLAGPCSSLCVQRGSYCGWCLRTQECSYYGDCSRPDDVWLHQCITIIPSTDHGNVAFNNETLSITFLPPLYQVGINIVPSTTKRGVEQGPTLACEFGSEVQPATVLDSNTIQCTIAQSFAERTVNLTVLYNGYRLASPVPFTYVACTAASDCQNCISRQYCGWCSTTKSCVTSSYCSAENWSSTICLVNDITGLVVGLVVAGVVLAAAGMFLFLFLRWRKRRRGLLIEVEEPDYVQVAFIGDLTLKFRISASDKYKELEEILMNKNDRTFLDCLINVTNPTEQEMMAKSLIFVAHSRGESADLIQDFLIRELAQWKDANTILRQNSIASRMFKFYSKLVGTRYLFLTLARVINELNTMAAAKAKAENEQDNTERGASLLAVDMELDPDKIKNESVDIDTHKYQLALACQKIFSAIRTNHDLVPDEFRLLFARMEATILQRFDDEAVYKALGGLLFLRFICPAITAPHYYGLLKEPPNNIAQRQLVLIAKVLQNLANMAKDVSKEKYMQELRDFTDRNIPKLQQFYQVILNPQNRGKPEAQLQLTVPEDVRLNSLATMHNHIVNSCDRLRQEFKKLSSAEKADEMEKLLQKIFDTYGQKGPKKSKQPKTSHKETND